MTRYYYKSAQLIRLVFSKSFFKPLVFTIFLSGIFIINSCEEDPTFIGKDILPSTDYVSLLSTDTFRIFSYTRYDYPVSTEAQTAPYIGSYYDPYFGSMKCEFVSQLRLEAEWTDGTYDVDSVKLFLRIMTVNGSNAIPKQLRITEISTMLNIDSTYYSDTTVDTTDFGVSVTIPELRNDSINNVEIPMPTFVGEYLIRDQEKLMYSTTAEDFRTYFKGVYMRIPSATDADPLLLGLTTNSYATVGDYSDYIIVYMHNRTDNSVYNFRFLLDPVKANANFERVERDFNTADPEKGISALINQPVLDTLSYIQGVNGVFTKIVIPGLAELRKNSYNITQSINKARLYVPVNYDDNLFSETAVPEQLYLRYYNKSGEHVLVPDYYIDDYHEYFGGTLDTAANMYKFNISNYIQEYLNDKDSILKPEIEIFQSATEVKNAIIKANDSKNPVKLELIITKY
jgi:hypothetical protein